MTGWVHRFWGRVLALALMLGVIALGIVFVAAPIRAAVTNTERDLKREQVLIAELSARIDRLKSADPEPEHSLDDLPLWPASASGSGDAEIQAAVQRLAAQSGLQPRAISAQTHPGVAGVEAVKVLLQLRAPYDQTAALLRDIENHTPRLLVETLTLRAIPTGPQASLQPLVEMRLELVAPRRALLAGGSQ